MTMQVLASLDKTAPARASPDFARDLVALIPHLRAFSRMLCGRRGVADDMTQEALAKAWRSRDAFEPGTNMKAWAFTILRNEFYSLIRRGKRDVLWDEDKAELLTTPDGAQQAAAELGDTARAMSALPADQREALILVGAGGFSYEEAAAICATPVGTMKSRVARARTALRAMLDGDAPLPAPALPSLKGAYGDILAQLNALVPPHAVGAATFA